MANENPPPETNVSLPASGIQYLDALKFLFSDANGWNNLLIAAVMNLIPIVGPIVLMGWNCEIIQRLCRRHPRPIPRLDFNDFVYFLSRGVTPFVAVLILSLPLTFLIVLLIFGGSLISGIMLGSTSAAGDRPELWLPIIFTLAILGFFLIILPMNVLMMSTLLRAELTEDFGETFEFRKIFAFAKATWKDFLIIYVVMMPLSFFLMIGGMMAFFVGIYVVIVIVNIAYLHLRWQIYERFLRNGGEAIPIQTKSGPVPSEAKLNVY